jgi:predicted nucleotidyltransferase
MTACARLYGRRRTKRRRTPGRRRFRQGRTLARIGLTSGARDVCYDAAVVTDPHESAIDGMASAARAMPGLRLLVLHGSRARGDARAASDWDLAYRADASFDPDALLATLADRLKADRIDLVDLDRAGALLRYNVARDGVVMFEREPGAFQRFWLDAVDTWCDLAPVLQPAYDRVLESLRR